MKRDRLLRSRCPISIRLIAIDQHSVRSLLRMGLVVFYTAVVTQICDVAIAIVPVLGKVFLVGGDVLTILGDVAIFSLDLFELALGTGEIALFDICVYFALLLVTLANVPLDVGFILRDIVLIFGDIPIVLTNIFHVLLDVAVDGVRNRLEQPPQTNQGWTATRVWRILRRRGVVLPFPLGEDGGEGRGRVVLR